METYGDGEASFGYTGQQYDEQTGLMYLRARYYAPGMGRFTSHDSWSGDANMPMSYNAWLYTNENPVNHIDLSGMCIDNNKDGICDSIYYPEYDGEMSLVDFDETSGHFSIEDKYLIESAAVNVANAYSNAYHSRIQDLIGNCEGNVIIDQAIQSSQNIGPISAFLMIHAGKIVFHKNAIETGYSAFVENPRKIWVYNTGTISRHGYNRSKFIRLFEHEIGHAFENAMWGTLGNRAGRKLISRQFTYFITPKVYSDTFQRSYNTYTPENSGDYYGFAGGSDWQFRLKDYNPAYSENYKFSDESVNGYNELGDGEIFADMFVGWVSNQWGDNEMGRARANFMNNNMPIFIRAVLDTRIGRAE